MTTGFGGDGRWPGPRHLPQLHQSRNARPGAGPHHAGAGAAKRNAGPISTARLRDGYRTGVIDMAPRPDRQPGQFHAMKVGRLHKLETLGLADQVGPGQWVISENAEATLRGLGERGDIIKHIHRGLAECGIERRASSYVLAAESLDETIIGRLAERGAIGGGERVAILTGVQVARVKFLYVCASRGPVWHCRPAARRARRGRHRSTRGGAGVGRHCRGGGRWNR